MFDSNKCSKPLFQDYLHCVQNKFRSSHETIDSTDEMSFLKFPWEIILGVISGSYMYL